ncbi:MAG: hypothetical protein ACKKL6_01615 [Candidatus Komeilibacteria bacterium]
MECGLSLSQEIKQELSPEQALELKLSLSQELSLDMIELLDESDDNPEATLDIVLQQVCKAIDSEELREAFQTVFGLNLLREILIKDHLELSVYSESSIRSTVVNFFAKMYKDGFPDLSSSGNKLHDKVPEGLVIKVFSQGREQSERDLNFLKETLKSQTDYRGTMEAFNELSNAIKIFDQYSVQVDNMCNIILHACQVHNQILISFFRDLVMIKQLNFLFAEKIQKRFVKKFRQIRRFDSTDSLANHMLNTISEYVLVGMGIVSPKLFSLRVFQQDPQYLKDIDEKLEKSGLTAKQLLQHYNLQTTGTVFFHRWHVLGHKLTRITDNLIRLFMTKTVRQCADELLTALDFESLIEEIKDLQGQKLKPTDLDVGIRELLVKSFTKKSFLRLIKGKIKTDWYRHLVIFLREAPTS